MKVEIVDYNPEWIEMYNQTKELFLNSFGDKIAAIEHIGSTSVPGLGAKPVIDILVGVKKLDDAESFIPDMESLGFEYVSKYEDVMPERRYFVKRGNKTSTHHIHTVEVSNPFWTRHLMFRDYLRTNDDVRDSYYTLKKELSLKEWSSGNEYADAKTVFIKGIEKEAARFISQKGEIAEAEALIYMNSTAPEEVIKECKLGWKRTGSSSAIKAAAIPVMVINSSIGLGMYEKATEEMIDEVLDFSSEVSNCFGIMISPYAEPQGIGELLNKRNLSIKSHWVKLYRDTSPVRNINTDLTVKQIGKEYSQEFANVITTAFGMPPVIKGLFRSIAGLKEMEHFMAFDKDVPVASGSLYINDDTAWFGLAGTIASHRNRGAQSALIAARINAAHEAGCKWITVETAEDKPEKRNPSFWNMIKHGFRIMYKRPNYVKVN